VKAFLLAAGEGRRLRPLTDSLPKCLVPIGGTPLLAIWLEALASNGVTHVLINVHHLHDKVVQFLTGFRTPLHVDIVHEPTLLGSAGTVLANRQFVVDERAFFIVYADVLTSIDLRRMARFHESRGEPVTIGLVPTDIPQEKGTVLVDSEGRVARFAEKAEVPLSNLSNAGIYVAGQEIFAHIPSGSAGRPVDFGVDVFPSLTPHIAAYPIEEFLMDIGTPALYELADREWGRLRVKPQLSPSDR
jgi:mannose-1-phosphate guanylyltransferase